MCGGLESIQYPYIREYYPKIVDIITFDFMACFSTSIACIQPQAELLLLIISIWDNITVREIRKYYYILKIILKIIFFFFP